MPIGTAERPINIKDLILDTPERARELPFDPERDITSEDWNGMILGLINDYRREGDWATFAGKAAKMLFLFPDRRHELNLNDDAWNGMKRKLGRDEKAKRWGEFSYLASSLFSLFPDRRNEIPLTETMWEGINKERELDRTQPDWTSFVNLTVMLFCLFPSRRSELSIDEHMWGSLQQYFENQKVGKHWYESFWIASRMVLLPPKSRNEISINETMWDGMRHELIKFRTAHHYDPFPGHAVAMKILAADDARITEDGQISITMRKPKKDFAPPTPPMPEVRRF